MVEKSHGQRRCANFQTRALGILLSVFVAGGAAYALERNYPQGTVMVRIDIRDAKITDFVNPRKFATGYLGTLANLQGADWSYYEGSSLVRHCIEKSGSLNEECRNSLDLELASLDFTIGVDCTKAQGLRTRKDMQSLLQRFVRESPTEARESGKLIGATAFLKYADPRLCPESATAAAARAEREERATRAAGGDAEDQYQLALRKFGEERAHWLCLAANKGHAAAQYEYGTYFETYEGDTVTAYRWHLLSKRGGYWQAPEAVSRLEGSLSSAEVAQTKSIVEHWKRDECP